ncbi:MAG TPA: FKBP-type peptidyl-prolyl cis-trans isomerase [Bacteroidia bacterium]|nr:FKBP-type peptidyl-prolyl cis-trans isomerase [Bacteroidia bacterium]
MKSPTIFTALMVLTLAISQIACNVNETGFKKTETGLEYRLVEKGSGTNQPKIGDLMIMDILYKTAGDSVLFDSKSKSDSFSVALVPPTFTGGVEEGFAMMHVGDSMLFKTSADSVFLKTFFHPALPEYIQKGSQLTFQVRLKKIISKRVADSLSLALDVQLRSEEFDRIDMFLKKEDMDVTPTKNGVYIKTLKAGKGIFAATGDSVYVLYKGMTLDGTVFDEASDPAKPLKIVNGIGMVIPGWDEAIPYLALGSKSKIVVPSDLAYGAKGYGGIPGYTTLVFDMEILKIIKKSK